jgi:hypothetical protein
VKSAVIHNGDVVAPEGWNQALLNIGEEHVSSHSSLDHHRGSHFIVAQGGDEGDRLSGVLAQASDTCRSILRTLTPSSWCFIP